ncbi:MAG: isoprenoid biosynthesis glyoxalase ElbB [Shewanella sp.]
MKKIAILLSGAGVFDGSEIHESVLSMLALSKLGVKYQCFAPNILQMHVVNHLNGEVESDHSRNVLVESARIARGEIEATGALELDEFDALIIPGGFGAAKNLCNFATNGSNCVITPEVRGFISQFVNSNKPVGFICIAPIMIPLLYGEGVIGTIGNDSEIAQAFNLMGGKHQEAIIQDIIVDEVNKLVSTPAYMLAGNIAEVSVGIEKLVKKVVEMI